MTIKTTVDGLLIGDRVRGKGEVLDLADELAQRFVKSGKAAPVVLVEPPADAAAGPETAALPPAAETADSPRRRRQAHANAAGA
jgi:hypothetical protein